MDCSGDAVLTHGSGDSGLAGAAEDASSSDGATSAAVAHLPSSEEQMASRAVAGTKESVSAVLLALSSTDLGPHLSDAILGLTAYLSHAYEACLTLPGQQLVTALEYVMGMCLSVDSFLQSPTPQNLQRVAEACVEHCDPMYVDQAMALESDLKRASKRFNADDSFTNAKKRCVRMDKVPIAPAADAPTEQPAPVKLAETAEAVTNENAPPQARFQPFFVEVVSNWMTLVKELNSRLKEPANAKLMGEQIKISPKNVDEYRLIQRFLVEKNLEFSGFSLKTEVAKKVAIRGLPAFADPNEIVLGLSALGFQVQKVHVIKQKKTKTALNIFLAYILPTNNWDTVYKVNSLCYMQVSIRAFNSTGVRQCYRCQRFNHSSYACHYGSRCVKCAGSHFARECPNPDTQTPKCANCDGAHTSNYSGCPMYPKQNKSKVNSAGSNQNRSQGRPVAPRKNPVKPPASSTVFAAAPAPSSSAWAAGPPSASAGTPLESDPVPLKVNDSAVPTPSKNALLTKMRNRRKPTQQPIPQPPRSEAPPPARVDNPAPSAETQSSHPVAAKRPRVSNPNHRSEINEMKDLLNDRPSQNDSYSIRQFILVLREIQHEISLYEDEGDKFMAFFEIYEKHFCVGSIFDGE